MPSQWLDQLNIQVSSVSVHHLMEQVSMRKGQISKESPNGTGKYKESPNGTEGIISKKSQNRAVK